MAPTPTLQSRLNDVLAGKADPVAKARGITYNPRSANILRGKLNEVLAMGGPAQDARARQIATKGPPKSIASRAFGDIAGLFTLPMRAVVATGAELGEVLHTSPVNDKRNWLQNVADPTYGFGRFLEQQGIVHPDSSSRDKWIARAAGLAGDIAFDPLTYLTFGANVETKLAGRSGGVATKLLDVAEKMALHGGEEAAPKVARIEELASKARSGLAKMSKADLAEASTAIDTKLGYGVGWHVPLTDFHGRVPLGKAGEAYGRGLEQAGAAVGKGVAKVPIPLTGTTLGKALGGGMQLAEQAAKGMFEGLDNATATKYGQSVLNALNRAKGTSARANRELGIEVDALERAAHKLVGKSDEASGAFNRIMEGRPTTHLIQQLHPDASAEEVAAILDDAWKNYVPEAMKGTKLDKVDPTKLRGVMQAYDEWFAKLPEDVRIRAKQGDVAPTWLMDSSRRGRPFVPRRPSDQFVESFGGSRSRVRIGERSGLEMAGLAPHAAEGTEGARNLEKFYKKYGEHLTEGKLHEPGSVVNVTDAEGTVTKQVMGPIEDQIHDAVQAFHGDKFVPWYSDDFFRNVRGYKSTLAQGIGNKTVENHLAWKGITKEMEYKSVPKWAAAAAVDVGAPAPTAGGTWFQAVADHVVDNTPLDMDTSLWANHLWLPNKAGEAGPGDLATLVNEIAGHLTSAGKRVDEVSFQEMQDLLSIPQRNLAAAEAAGLSGPKIDLLRRQVESVRMLNEQFSAHASDLAETVSRREALETELAVAKGQARTYKIQRQIDLLKEREEALAIRDGLDNEGEARVAHLHANSMEGEATLAALDNPPGAAAFKNTAETADKLVRVLHPGWEGFGFGREAPSSVVQMLADVNKQYDPLTGEGLRNFLGHFDKLNNWMKGWLTATPGFQWRNAFGGTFNNWLAGVDMKRSPFEWGRIMAKDPAKMTAHEQAVVRILDQVGVVGTGAVQTEVVGGKGWSLNPFAGIRNEDKAFVMPYWTRRMSGQKVEPWLRGTLAYDRLDKAVSAGRFAKFTDEAGKEYGIRSLKELNGDNVEAFVRAVDNSPLMDEMINDVYKYHFDYDNLSRFERQAGRRIIPFYTWTRKNVPLQLELMFTEPGKSINRYMAVKRNLEFEVPGQSVVPSYFGETNMIHTPFQAGGNDVYGGVDLPFNDPFKALDIRGQLVGMLNPFIKAPLESYVAGKQFFSDVPLTANGAANYQPMPGTWARIPGLPQALQAVSSFTPLSKPIKGRDGRWMMTQQDTYFLGQYLPFLYQAQRLMPMDEDSIKGKPSKYQKRLVTTYLSYLSGTNFRTNTPQDMESELYRRADILTTQGAQLKQLGYTKAKPVAPADAATPPGMDLRSQLATLLPSRGAMPTEPDVPAYGG